LEDFYGVLNDYDKIIELGVPPDNTDMATMYNNKAYTLVKLKKFNEALPLVNKAIQLNSNQWYIWDTRGEIYFQLGYYQKCIEDMTKAISIKADQNSYFFRGFAKIKMSDKTSGCQDLSKSGELGNANAYTEIKKYCQ
jgi:tetratricopeptide (TPR) repeat protein